MAQNYVCSWKKDVSRAMVVFVRRDMINSTIAHACLQEWPSPGDVQEAAQVFTHYAQDIMKTDGLATLTEPYTVLHKKLVCNTYKTWQKKLSDWTFPSLLGYRQ